MKLKAITVLARVHPSTLNKDQAGIPHQFRALVPYIGEFVRVTFEVATDEEKLEYIRKENKNKEKRFL